MGTIRKFLEEDKARRDAEKKELVTQVRELTERCKVAEMELARLRRERDEAIAMPGKLRAELGMHKFAALCALSCYSPSFPLFTLFSLLSFFLLFLTFSSLTLTLTLTLTFILILTLL